MLIYMGYSLAVAMGFVLGLIGAGGSILTVPILVYCMNIKPEIATGYSLLIVGSAALMGAWRYCMRGLVNFRAAAIFMIPAMLMVRYTRTHIVPSLPATILFSGILPLSKDNFIMVMFALLMLLAACFMLRPLKVEMPKLAPPMTFGRFLRLVFASGGIGLLTGMVGAGGGFLIIPTLIGLFGLQVKEAVATSLAIIAVNSLVGFSGDIARGIPIDEHLLVLFLLLTCSGMWIGTSLAKRINSRHLRSLFGWFVLLVACGVLAHHLFFTK